MYYYDRDSQDKAAQDKVELYRTITACYPVFADVVRAFNNKVFNCRLEDALNVALAKKFGTYNIDGHEREFNNVRIHVQKESKWISFLIYTRHHNDGYSIAFLKKDDLKDGKRIPADILIKSAREKREDFLKRAAQLEHDIQMIDTYKQQLNSIIKAFDSITGNISYDAKDIYRIGYRITK